ncbi:hypothetical protein HU200_029021 [Digitaria exilis]|uniref:Uncharacterized protein n=1 Tax=Digitaria exilis TaxID=1010633 RepID=A0A835ETE7_9POAL|nr:hypothetical protein HU200_029021 [Digitaria exilis]
MSLSGPVVQRPVILPPPLSSHRWKWVGFAALWGQPNALSTALGAETPRLSPRHPWPTTQLGTGRPQSAATSPGPSTTIGIRTTLMPPLGSQAVATCSASEAWRIGYLSWCGIL